MPYEDLKISETAAPPADAWGNWRAGIKNTEPESYGEATVADRGLYYFEQTRGQWQSAWEDSMASGLDNYNRQLNQEGLTKIHRTYKFTNLSNKFPGKVVQTNVIPTKQLGWPAEKLKVGDRVELFVWLGDEGFTQIAYKKKEVSK